MLSPEEIVVARDHLDAMLSSMPDRQVVYKDGEHKEVAAPPEYLTEPHPRHACWLELCRHPRILEAVEQVLGPKLILIMSHLIVKRAGDGLSDITLASKQVQRITNSRSQKIFHFKVRTSGRRSDAKDDSLA